LSPKPFAKAPQTLGEHIKLSRLQSKLTQKQAAKLLGVGLYTVLNWEKNRTTTPVQAIPAIFRFLGYDPFPQPRNLPERLLAKRREMGWTIQEAARELGVDEGTWGAWERGVITPWPRYVKLVERFLAGSV
jgi:transcriptional regulator with XRE-family HTH domain